MNSHLKQKFSDINCESSSRGRRGVLAQFGGARGGAHTDGATFSRLTIEGA